MDLPKRLVLPLMLRTATDWTSTGLPVAGKQVVIKLGGAGKGVAIKQLNVSTYLNGCCTTQSRYSALRSFEAYSCRTDDTPTASNLNPTCSGAIAAGMVDLLFTGLAPRS